MPYIAYHVDIFGNALACYELKATDDEAAKAEGRAFLRNHTTIEAWNGPRWIARFVREDAVRGH
jgi:hypothetical protein